MLRIFHNKHNFYKNYGERALYTNDNISSYDFRNRNIYLMTSLIIVHPPTCQMPEKIRSRRNIERKEKRGIKRES